MDIMSYVRNYIKKNISSQEESINHTPFIDSLYQYTIDEATATQLVWVILGTIDFFHDDFDTVILKCPDDLTYILLQFCIEKGADINESIQQQNDINWYAKYPDFSDILNILFFIGRISIRDTVSILVVVMARCMAYSDDPSTIMDSDMVQLILDNMTRQITVYEVYLYCKINAIERVKTQRPSMPLVDLLLQKNCFIPTTTFYDAVDCKDSVLCQYYLKHHKDEINVPSIILRSNNCISLRVVEHLSKSIVSSYHTELGNTLLHLACKRGHEQLVKVLLCKGVDVNKINKFGESALFWAIKNGNPYIVSHILRKRVNQSYDTLLGYTKRFNRPTVRKVILEFKYATRWYSKTKVTVLSLTYQFRDVDLGIIQKIVAFT